MMKFILSFGLIVAAKVISAQIPDDCKNFPVTKMRPCECCDMPKLFMEEDIASCGLVSADLAPVDPSAPPTDVSCDKDICIMKKVGMLTGDDKINKEASKAIIDKIASVDPDFTDFVDIVKSNCLDRDLTNMGPPGICLPHKTLKCMLFHTITKCPKWKEVDDCIEMKQRVERCSQFYPKF